MASAIDVSATIAQLQKFGSDTNQYLKDETEATGRQIELDAKSRAPVDLGTLRQSISYRSINNGFGAAISVNVKYAAYQEFGTGGFVMVPDELRELAEYYKGKGVKQVNLKPQPYLYPSLVLNRKKYVENIQKRIDQLERDFNRR